MSARTQITDAIRARLDDRVGAAELADQVVAVLADVLTSSATVEAMGMAIFDEIKKYPTDPLMDVIGGRVGWGARPVDVGRAAAAAAARALAEEDDL